MHYIVTRVISRITMAHTCKQEGVLSVFHFVEVLQRIDQRYDVITILGVFTYVILAVFLEFVHIVVYRSLCSFYYIRL